MKFHSLDIHRTASYATVPNQLEGVAELIDEGAGKISIALDHAAIIAVLEVIKTCVDKRAKHLARTAVAGLEDGIAEVFLAQDSFSAIEHKE